MLANMSFLSSVARDPITGANTYGGIPFANQLPQRWTVGLFVCEYMDYHLLISSANRWEEFPDLTRFGDMPSFGVMDNSDQMVDNPLFRHLQNDRTSNWCVVITNAACGHPQTELTIPSQFGKYYGTRSIDRANWDKPLRTSGLYCCYYSVFRYF